MNNISIEEDYAIMKIHSDSFGDFQVIIDIDDVNTVQMYRWCMTKMESNKCNYEKFYIYNSEKKMLLHRLLTDCPKGLVVDHIDGDSMNNRKSNLRICTASENRHNSKTPRDNKSGHKGVIWNKHLVTPKWMAYIGFNKRRKTLGYFDTYEDACRAREEAEKKYFGEYRFKQ